MGLGFGFGGLGFFVVVWVFFFLKHSTEDSCSALQPEGFFE